ncbi:MAG TPA: hypothetical protein VEQ87_18600 [Burkholderiales bacterium]|nr:hypothetical protein [Burkholderiales bacterium]
MKRILLTLALTLSACSYFQDPGQIEGTIVAPGNFTAGSGVIIGVGVLPNANKDKARPSSPGQRPDPNLYRVTVRMDVGGIQSVDIDNNTFVEGEAVELTNDGRMVHVTGTSLNRAIR